MSMKDDEIINNYMILYDIIWYYKLYVPACTYSSELYPWTMNSIHHDQNRSQYRRPRSGVFHLGSKGWIRNREKFLQFLKNHEFQDINHGKKGHQHTKWVCHVCLKIGYHRLPHSIHCFIIIFSGILGARHARSPKSYDLEPVDLSSQSLPSDEKS